MAADDITKPHTFAAGTTAESAKVNENYDTIFNVINNKASRTVDNTFSGNNTHTGTNAFSNTLSNSGATNLTGNLSVTGATTLGVFNYALATGSANTYLATLNPAPSALVAGLKANIKINVTNDGASTLNLNSLGIKSIIKNGGEALKPGDLPANGIVSLTYTGTSWHLDNVKQALDKNGVGGPPPAWASAATVTIPEGCWVNADDGSRRIQASSDLTVDLSVSGANGLDTGSEASSTNYYLWLCQGSSGICGLLSTSASSPTLPSGYVSFKGLLPVMFRNDSSSNLLVVECNSWGQGAVEVQYLNRADVLCVSGFTSTSFTNISNLSNFVPSFAKSVKFLTESGGLQDISFSPDGATTTDIVTGPQAGHKSGTSVFIPVSSGNVQAKVSGLACTIYASAYKVITW